MHTIQSEENLLLSWLQRTYKDLKVSQVETSSQDLNVMVREHSTKHVYVCCMKSIYEHRTFLSSCVSFDKSSCLHNPIWNLHLRNKLVSELVCKVYPIAKYFNA
jgi:hypothetical protein